MLQTAGAFVAQSPRRTTALAQTVMKGKAVAARGPVGGSDRSGRRGARRASGRQGRHRAGSSYATRPNSGFHLVGFVFLAAIAQPPRAARQPFY